MRCRRAGFTLLELVVALAVIGVTFTLTLPALRLPERPTPGESAVTATVHLLESARRAAIRGGRAVEVTIDPTTGRYWIRGAEEEPGSTSGQLAAAPAVEFQSVAPRVRYVFRPDGTAASEALTLVVDGRAVALSVDAWTGRVHASR